MLPCLWVWNLPSYARVHTGFGETSMKAEGGAPAKEQKGKAGRESQVCTAPHRQLKLKESLICVYAFTWGIFASRAVSVTNHTSWHSEPCLCSRPRPCLTPEATVSSAIKCNVGCKLEAPSSSSLDATKASLFPQWAIGSGTGLNWSDRGTATGLTAARSAGSASLNAFPFLATWLDTFPEQGDREKKQKKKCFT